MSKIDTKDRDGVGKTLIRKMEDAIGGVSGFRTRIHKEPGREVMLRTKGGMPEVTEKTVIKEKSCIKGPLTEIAFKYINPTAITGYRRWYGEPDPALATAEKIIKYEWSSDGLLCVETRKLQKICFKDADGESVDFLFAERPADDTVPDSNLPVVNPDAAGATSRFRFTEGKYSEREWYASEAADIGWAFSGPTIFGEQNPEPASAVKFFIHRLRSIMFSVSDSLGKIVTSKVKWIFANQTYSDRTLGQTKNACVNQNARELSFNERHFFTPSTDGNMDKLTMSVGLDEPPAVAGGPSFTVEFKKPGSFIAAIDPEGAIGNARPVDVSKAIDMCNFSAFGNPYHGLFWWVEGGTPILYKDELKNEQWSFTPTPPQVPLISSLFGGYLLDHRYYNFSNVDPLVEENIVRTSINSDGAFYKDALLVCGQWWVVDADEDGWGNLYPHEQLYKDANGTVWVLSFEGSYNEATLSVEFDIRLKRRYGILGTKWRYGTAADNADRQLITFSTYTGGAYLIHFVSQSPDGSEFLVGMRNASDHVSRAWVVTVDGDGALQSNAQLGIIEGSGITASVREWVISNEAYSINEPIMTGSNIGTFIGMTFSTNIVNKEFTCGPNTSMSWHKEIKTATYSEVETGFSRTVLTFEKKVLDIQWVDGSWQEVCFTSSVNEQYPKLTIVSVTDGVKTREMSSCVYDGTNWVPSFSVTETFLSVTYQMTPRVTTLRKVLTRGGAIVDEWLWSQTVVTTPVITTWTSESNYASSGGDIESSIISDEGGWGKDGLPNPVSLTPYPRTAVHVGYWAIPSPGKSPLAWTVTNKNLTAPALRPNVPLIFRDGTTFVDPYVASQWTNPADGKLVSSRIGWAYDYRKKIIVPVPFGSLAYFI